MLDLCWEHKGENTAGAVESVQFVLVCVGLCWICVGNTNAKTQQALLNSAICVGIRVWLL